jgi:cytoskeletal protein RodZ
MNSHYANECNDCEEYRQSMQLAQQNRLDKAERSVIVLSLIAFFVFFVLFIYTTYKVMIDRRANQAKEKNANEYNELINAPLVKNNHRRQLASKTTSPSQVKRKTDAPDYESLSEDESHTDEEIETTANDDQANLIPQEEKKKKSIKKPKHWREAKNDSPASHKEPSSTQGSKSSASQLQPGEYAINKAENKLVYYHGKISIHPGLKGMINGEQLTVLKNLCANSRVIPGSDTKGKTGLIRLDRAKDKNKYKDSGFEWKLKNCAHDVRFFAEYKPGGASDEFVVTACKPKHKKGKLIRVAN